MFPTLSDESKKKLGRRERKNTILSFVILAAAAVTYWLHPSDIVILGAVLLLALQHIERRLNAIQLRLAWMHDQLDVLSGGEPEGHVEDELDAGDNAWA
jgi:hypothetical protein